MTDSDKIKKIRTFPGKTQKELGVATGFDEKGADNRIAQYETNYRISKTGLLGKIAEVLNVDRQNFYTIAPGLSVCFNLSAVPVRRGPPMIPPSDTMAMTIGPLALLWEFTFSTPCGRVHAGVVTAPAGTSRRGDHQGRIL